MKNLSLCEERLKNMIVSDKKENPMRIVKIVKSEVLYVLKNYFEITASDIDVEIGVNEEGRYQININGVSRAIKVASCFVGE